MNKLKKHTSSTWVLRIATAAAAVLVLVLFPSLSRQIDSAFETAVLETVGGGSADSNIIVVEITKRDINRLGWPLKRSYYALLIDYLNKLEVRKIGIEVFLSKSRSAQSIYNNLLSDKAVKSGNIIFSSVFQNIDELSGIGGGLEKPQFTEGKSSIETGHINFITDNGLRVLNRIGLPDGSFEESFALKLSGGTEPGDFKINFVNRREDFRSISLLEFFALVGKRDGGLEYFRDKIVIVGVTDPSLSKTFTAHFEQFPGTFVHAQAVQNLLNSSFYTDGFYFPTALVLFALITFVYFNPRLWGSYKPWTAAGIFIVVLICGFAYFQFHCEIAFSSLVLPLLIYSGASMVLRYFSQSELLISAEKRKSELEVKLSEKETELNDLLQLADLKSGGDTVNRIELLKSEIELIRNQKKDFEPVSIPDESVKVFEGMVFRSRKMERVADLVKKAAPQIATVLIQGESGSGKELVAKAIHKLSNRSNMNFLAVNCAALSEQLLESELFGHVKGAFTNASGDKQGLFEAADGGTLFLDEIGETSENFQSKLLRVLQSGEIQKVGSTKTISVDVRVIAATNKNLSARVAEGKFREDLFYRINVLQVELPSLRERTEDILPLAEHFLKKENPGLQLSRRAAEQLAKYSWRGNVRELESAMKRAAIFANSEKRNIVTVGDLPPGVVEIDKSKFDELILESLRAKKFSHSSISETASELGGYNRTVVSENFRGLFFKYLCDADFEFDMAVKTLAGADDPESVKRIRSKGEKYLQNVKTDVIKNPALEFTELKEKLSSKYKNLPQKFHPHLDQIIRHFIVQKPE